MIPEFRFYGTPLLEPGFIRLVGILRKLKTELMRKMFTLCLLLLYSICFSQQITFNSLGEALNGRMPSCGVVTYQKKDTIAENRFVIRCATTCLNTEPLIVVDGIPLTRNSDINKISVNDIETVTVLKNPSATAIFGRDGANGVLLVTTKGINERKFIIKDLLDGSRIAGATVSFTSITDKNDKLQFAANDSGVVVTNKLNRSTNYKTTVSAVGHQTLEGNFGNSYNTETKEILLAREIKTCPEVVVTCFECVRTIHCGYRITVIKSSEVSNVKQKTESFTVFPNPVSKGRILNIKFKTTDSQKKILRVLSVDGRLLSTIPVNTDKARSGFQIQTDGRWAAGIYFVQLLYENGQVVASEKVILQ